MSKKNEEAGTAQDNDKEGAKQAGPPQEPVALKISRQYVKDISFENPNAPETIGPHGRPETNVNFYVHINPLDEKEDLYESVITIQVSATRKEKTLYIIELAYGIEVSLEGIDKKKHPHLLYAEAPRIAFPFVRQEIATLTEFGGYPPLLLAPINFYAMYKQQAKQFQKTQKQKNGDGQKDDRPEKAAKN